MRYGTVPGTRLRTRNRISIWLAHRIRQAASLPSAFGNIGCMEWEGVIPAITTPFNEDLSIDFSFLAQHCNWLVDNGCKGVVALGSLGEGATLTRQEKEQVLETCVKAIGDRAFVLSGISALGTAEAVSIAKSAEAIGCDALMVLPPYVYVGDWR